MIIAGCYWKKTTTKYICGHSRSWCGHFVFKLPGLILSSKLFSAGHHINEVNCVITYKTFDQSHCRLIVGHTASGEGEWLCRNFQHVVYAHRCHVVSYTLTWIVQVEVVSLESTVRLSDESNEGEFQHLEVRVRRCFCAVGSFPDRCTNRHLHGSRPTWVTIGQTSKRAAHGHYPRKLRHFI